MSNLLVEGSSRLSDDLCAHCRIDLSELKTSLQCLGLVWTSVLCAAKYNWVQKSPYLQILARVGDDGTDI